MKALVEFLRHNPGVDHVRIRLVAQSPQVRARIRESRSAFDLRNPGDIGVVLDYLNRNPEVVCVQLSLAPAGAVRLRSLCVLGSETFENSLVFDAENDDRETIFRDVLKNHADALRELKRKLSRA